VPNIDPIDFNKRGRIDLRWMDRTIMSERSLNWNNLLRLKKNKKILLYEGFSSLGSFMERHALW